MEHKVTILTTPQLQSTTKYFVDETKQLLMTRTSSAKVGKVEVQEPFSLVRLSPSIGEAVVPEQLAENLALNRTFRETVSKGSLPMAVTTDDNKAEPTVEREAKRQKQVEGYVFFEQIGSFGSVYLAADLVEGNLVAIKRLKTEAQNTKEIITLKFVKHDNIITYYEHIFKNKSTYSN